MEVETIRRKATIFFGLVIFFMLYINVIPKLKFNYPKEYGWLFGTFPVWIILIFIIVSFLKW